MKSITKTKKIWVHPIQYKNGKIDYFWYSDGDNIHFRDLSYPNVYEEPGAWSDVEMDGQPYAFMTISEAELALLL